jgi:hypothetical protein
MIPCGRVHSNQECVRVRAKVDDDDKDGGRGRIVEVKKKHRKSYRRKRRTPALNTAGAEWVLRQCAPSRARTRQTGHPHPSRRSQERAKRIGRAGGRLDGAGMMTRGGRGV